MQKLIIQGPLDTARIAASYRAIASEQANAPIHDPYARLLAGERGEELMQGLYHETPEVWPITVRTGFYDEQIQRLVQQEAVDTVINLAAGLDTRPYRLQLPAMLRWIEVDRAEVLAYKEEILAQKQPSCLLERIMLDVTCDEERHAFLSRVCDDAQKVLILTEGLLVYLTEAQVIALAADLHDQISIHWWLTEFITPLMLEQDHQHWNPLAADDVKTRFAPREGSAFFRGIGWDIAEFRAPLEEALRLRLPLRIKWFVLLLAWIAWMLSKYTHQYNENLGSLVLLTPARDDAPSSSPEEED